MALHPSAKFGGSQKTRFRLETRLLFLFFVFQAIVNRRFLSLSLPIELLCRSREKHIAAAAFISSPAPRDSAEFFSSYFRAI